MPPLSDQQKFLTIPFDDQLDDEALDEIITIKVRRGPFLALLRAARQTANRKMNVSYSTKPDQIVTIGKRLDILRALYDDVRDQAFLGVEITQAREGDGDA